MGHNPHDNSIAGRRDAPRRVDSRPQDPRTNTRPRGNGARDGDETEKSTRKLKDVLGH
jgi:hypothetical protein